MLKKHVILFESKGCGWIAYSTAVGEAKRMLSVNITHNSNLFYIFECNLLQQFPYTMKLKVPFHLHYHFKKINVYKEVELVEFAENEEYITISYTDADGGICLDVKHVI
jgi:hypothetical protein